MNYACVTQLFTHPPWYAVIAVVAQEMAIARPSAIDGLMLVCTSAEVGEEVHCSFPLHNLLEKTAQQRTEEILLLADARREDSWLVSHT